MINLKLDVRAEISDTKQVKMLYVWDDYDFLTERTLSVFKERFAKVIEDMTREDLIKSKITRI